uniref:RNA polymerase-associated protein RTF1 homolog n=2 Tax=Hirondellea gigas TaxID=1518452 RepID=A0A2P2I483_9CRUS
MNSKRKGMALTDSDSDESASDSELLNIAKKRPRNDSISSDDDASKGGGEGGGSRSSSASPPKKRKAAASANGNSSPRPSTQLRPGSDSDTSDSDSDWGAHTVAKKKKKQPLPKTRKSRISQTGSESEPEEGEVSDSSEEDVDSNDGSGVGSYDGEEEFDDGLDDNLIGDEADRARLENMTEKEREQELFNRIEKREVLKTRFDIEKKLRLAKKQEQRKKREKDPDMKIKDKDKDKSSGSVTAAPLPSDRKKTLEENKAGRTEKFAALKAKRDSKKMVEEKEKEKKEAAEEKETKEKADVQSSDSDGSEKGAKQKLNPSQVFSSEDESDHSSVRSSSPKRRQSRSSSSSSSSSDSGSDKSAGSGSGASSSRGSRSRRVERSTTVTSKEQLERIRLSRHKMELFVHLPLFCKAIIGCFVRVGIGNSFGGNPVYRIAEITEVCETAKVYTLGKTKTNKGLRLRHGKQERVFRLEFISNNKFSDSEYSKWVESCASHDVPLPSLDSLQKKEKDIRDLLNYNYTNDDIDTIVTERLRFTNRPTNYAVAKTELLKKRDIAKQCGDQEEVEKVNEQIAELDSTSTRLDKRRTATISSISYINERNRKQNVIKAEVAIRAEVERMKGQRARDPFTRRQTRPTIVSLKTNTMTDEERKAIDDRVAAKELKLNQRKAEDANRKKLEIEKAQEEERKRILEEDLYAAHNFDLNIDFGHTMPLVSTPAAPNRSSCAASANGTTVNTPRRSLNLEEYKKKKGLL